MNHRGVRLNGLRSRFYSYLFYKSAPLLVVVIPTDRGTYWYKLRVTVPVELPVRILSFVACGIVGGTSVLEFCC
jgi:hypothetical protein